MFCSSLPHKSYSVHYPVFIFYSLIFMIPPRLFDYVIPQHREIAVEDRERQVAMVTHILTGIHGKCANRHPVCGCVCWPACLCGVSMLSSLCVHKKWT